MEIKAEKLEKLEFLGSKQIRTEIQILLQYSHVNLDKSGSACLTVRYAVITLILLLFCSKKRQVMEEQHEVCVWTDLGSNLSSDVISWVTWGKLLNSPNLLSLREV